MPAISIGLPVYNGSHLIASAINSVLAQTETDIELIVSDNYSSDNTSEIVNKFAALDSRVRLIRQEKNIGASRNFEFVRTASSGKYFTWLSHDDYWMPNHLRILRQKIEHFDADFAASLPFFFHASSNKIFHYLDISQDLFGSSMSNNLKNFIELDFWLHAKACLIYGLYKRELMFPLTPAIGKDEEKLESLLGGDLIYIIESLARLKFQFTDEKTWFRSERYIPDMVFLDSANKRNIFRYVLYESIKERTSNTLVVKIKSYREIVFNALLRSGAAEEAARRISVAYENQLVNRFFYLKNLWKYS